MTKCSELKQFNEQLEGMTDIKHADCSKCHDDTVNRWVFNE